MGKNQIDAREEMVRFAGTHNDMIAALCDLANEPLAKGNEDLTSVLTQSNRGGFDAFLSQLQREDFTPNGILNLLHVFDSWYIRDKELVAKLKPHFSALSTVTKKTGIFRSGDGELAGTPTRKKTPSFTPPRKFVANRY